MAEIRNIVTEGFDVRGQVDLINIQSMLDGQFKYLLNYIDHGVKKLTSIPLISKRASSIKQLDAMDLREAYEGWRSLPRITEREAARYILSVGGQGIIHCMCRGTCTTNACSCKKAGRLCSSRCHRNSKTCKNMHEK